MTFHFCENCGVVIKKNKYLDLDIRCKGTQMYKALFCEKCVNEIIAQFKAIKFNLQKSMLLSLETLFIEWVKERDTSNKNE